jgi:hypothetical protein
MLSEHYVGMNQRVLGEGIDHDAFECVGLLSLSLYTESSSDLAGFRMGSESQVQAQPGLINCRKGFHIGSRGRIKLRINLDEFKPPDKPG